MKFERHHSALIVASLVTVASFIGATIYTQHGLGRLDALSSAIETNAVPSTEYLSRAAVRLTRLSQMLDDASITGTLRASSASAAAREVQALDADVSEYLQLTPLAGENEFWASLRTDVSTAVQLVRTAIDQEQRGIHSPDLTNGRVDDALDRAEGSVLAALSFDIRQSEMMARAVRTVRLTTLRMIVILDGLSTAVALLAVVIAYRASRRHDELLKEHNTLLSARVTELDRFAGRVAHDVLSPLETIAVALALLRRSGDERSRKYIDRSARALQRVQQLVQGLLTFARSAARPDPAARCAVDAVLPTIVADFGEAAEKEGIDVVVETSGPVLVACSLGVMTSIVQNLVRNAIKYIGHGPVKRIVVRAQSSGSVARLEVEDTGRGIPADALATIFEPFVRGSHEDVAGTGLGLATVKRLVEAHGGTIGVQSKPGIGSVFRVELPLASGD